MVLDVTVNEKSFVVIVLTFLDEDETAVVPKTLSYTLTDNNGTIINSKSNVTLTPSLSVSVTLSGDDLKIINGNTTRVFTVSGTIDSSAGTGLPIKEEATFDIVDLLNIT